MQLLMTAGAFYAVFMLAAFLTGNPAISAFVAVLCGYTCNRIFAFIKRVWLRMMMTLPTTGAWIIVCFLAALTSLFWPLAVSAFCMLPKPSGPDTG